MTANLEPPQSVFDRSAAGRIFFGVTALLIVYDIPRWFIHKLRAFIGEPQVFFPERVFKADVCVGCGWMFLWSADRMLKYRATTRLQVCSQMPHRCGVLPAFQAGPSHSRPKRTIGVNVRTKPRHDQWAGTGTTYPC